MARVPLYFSYFQNYEGKPKSQNIKSIKGMVKITSGQWNPHSLDINRKYFYMH